MALLQKFKAHLEDLGIQSGESVLLAVSGGLDSMVLLDLAIKSELQIVVAHVNYNMRGQESLDDEKLVENFCAQHHIDFISKSVKIAPDEIKDGFQSEARKVRYNWFNDLCQERHLNFILTAHHLNDRIETFFINLIRGAGLKGLKSIPNQKNKVRRPLLNFEKTELEVYANKHQVPWRFDKSNASNDYLRNKIRHGLIQEFKNLSVKAEQNAAKSLDYLAEADSYFQRLAKKRIGQFKMVDEIIEIKESEWNQLFSEKPLHKYVFEMLGFYPEQLDRLENFSQSQSGKRIEGIRRVVFRDRDKFLVKDLVIGGGTISKICNPEGEIEKPLHLKWQIVKNVNQEDFKNPNLAYLQFSKLSFPLTLRPWRKGDRFKPYGMNGSKKMSDFLTDLKISVPEKERTYVLVSESEIVWVVGLRVAQGFGITKNDKSILKLELST